MTKDIDDRPKAIVFSESETARRLDVSVSGLRKWRREGTGPQFIRIGRLIRYSIEDIQAWLMALKRGTK
jgi:predicted DNA-binding transcriptional regulator AlpA